MGTVIDGPADFYSGRLPKAQRKKATLTDQLLADSDISQVGLVCVWHWEFKALTCTAAACLRLRKKATLTDQLLADTDISQVGLVCV